MNNQRRTFIRQITFIAAGTVLCRPVFALAASDKQLSRRHLAEGENAIFLKDSFLTKDMADALCTLIVLGYAKKVDKCTFRYEKTDKPEDAAKDLKAHTDIQKMFAARGVKVTIDTTTPATDFSFVFARTGRASNEDAVKAMLDGDYGRYLQNINKNANAKKSPPFGAYIGGMSAVDKLTIVGPSKLDQYTPVYRDADEAAIKKSYEDAKNNSNIAIDALKSTNPAANKQKVTQVDLIAPESRSFSPGSLFKSYHGMVLAMVRYGAGVDPNKFIFEIALGNKTTKIASCFACSAFMEANETPASATHLGRGDNWNIPAGEAMSGQMKDAWAKKITEWYTTGKGLIPTPKTDSAVKSLYDAMAQKNRESKVSEIFLEALTFEDPFTKRILKTLDKA